MPIYMNIHVKGHEKVLQFPFSSPFDFKRGFALNEVCVEIVITTLTLLLKVPEQKTHFKITVFENENHDQNCSKQTAEIFQFRK